jgi:hypothetical protein
MGNASDRIVLTSGTMISSTGGSFTLTLLDSANDPNKLLQPFQSVAYVTANDLNNIQPSTAYAVSINGTVNGTPFSRNFTMTTENDLATGTPFPDPTKPQPKPQPKPTPAPAPTENPDSIKGVLPVEIPGMAPIHATTPVAEKGIKGTLPIDIPGRTPIDAPSPIFRPGAPSTPQPKPTPAPTRNPGSIKGVLPVEIPGMAPIHATTPVAEKGIKGTLPIDIPGRTPIDAPSPIFRPRTPSTHQPKPTPTPTQKPGSIKGVLPVEIPGTAPIHATTPVAEKGIKGTLPIDTPGRTPIDAPSPILFPGTASGRVSDTTSGHVSGKSSATTDVNRSIG